MVWGSSPKGTTTTLSNEEAQSRGISTGKVAGDFTTVTATGNKSAPSFGDYGGNQDSPTFADPYAPELPTMPQPAPLPSATSATSYELFRPTGYGYGWDEAPNAFGLVSNPNAMNAFVTGGFRGTPQEYFAQFGGAPNAQPSLGTYQAPTIPGLPDAPQQGGGNPFYAARQGGGQNFVGDPLAGGRQVSGAMTRFGAPTSRVVDEPITGMGSFSGWEGDWQNRFNAEESRRGEGQREAGYFGPTREEYAGQVAQARGINDPSVILDTLLGRMDNYGPETMQDFGAIERMTASAPQSGWNVGGSTTTTRTPTRAADGVAVNWNEAVSRNPFDANFNPADFGGVTSRQDFFGQRAQAMGAPDWSDGLVRMALGDQPFQDMMGYERPFDPGFAGFDPTFEILTEEQNRLQPAFQNNQRLQEAYDNMTARGEVGGLLPEGYTMPDFRRVDGQTSANAQPLGMGQAMAGGDVSGVNADWLGGVYDPRQGEVSGVYDPRRQGGLGGLGGVG